ncbi:MAG: hypothetical protein JWN52_6755 [Actinomycetia bacterium]|nr:hypothetical protein [Actinomycetes bacterium]
MSETEPRIQIETCLAELHQHLTALGVTVTAIRDQDGRACLEVYDRHARCRRVQVFAQFFCATGAHLGRPPGHAC